MDGRDFRVAWRKALALNTLQIRGDLNGFTMFFLESFTGENI